MSTKTKRCSDTLTCMAEMIHGRSTSLLRGNCACQRGRMESCKGCLLQSSSTKWNLHLPAPQQGWVALPSEQGKQMAPQLQSAGTLIGFTLFKTLASTSTSSKFSLQPKKERGDARTWLFLLAAIQLSLLSPCFSSLAIRKVQGTHSGVDITAAKTCDVGATF